LIFVLRHSTGAMERETLMPRRISSGSWSETVLPSSILPMRVMVPEVNSIASVRVVFPAPLCPTRTTFRIFRGS
jgi:hypothetical protein